MKPLKAISFSLLHDALRRLRAPAVVDVRGVGVEYADHDQLLGKLSHLLFRTSTVQGGNLQNLSEVQIFQKASGSLR